MRAGRSYGGYGRAGDGQLVTFTHAWRQKRNAEHRARYRTELEMFMNLANGIRHVLRNLWKFIRELGAWKCSKRSIEDEMLLN